MSLILVIKALYFMLPIYFANMAPVLARHHFRSLGTPIDGKKRFRGREIFGSHKTWRGLIIGVLVGVLVFKLQQLIGLPSIVDYSKNSVLLGFLMGFGALFGDMVASFIKRQLDVAPGKSFPILDQIDYIVGGLLFSGIVVDFSTDVVLIILIASPILTIIANHVAFYFHIREEKW